MLELFILYYITQAAKLGTEMLYSFLLKITDVVQTIINWWLTEHLFSLPLAIITVAMFILGFNSLFPSDATENKEEVKKFE